MDLSVPDGCLLLVASPKARESGYVFYAKLRTKRGRQVKRRVGFAWVEVGASGAWRTHRGHRPRGYVLPNEATLLMRELILKHTDALIEAEMRDKRGPHMSFARLAADWHRNGCTIGDWKPATQRNYENQLRIHLLPAFGKSTVKSIDGAKVREWWRRIHDPRYRQGALSNRNANAILSTLRAIFNWAMVEEIVDKNPTLGIKKHRELPPDKAPFFSPEEVMALVRTAEQRYREASIDPERRERSAASRHDAGIFLVAAFTGLRRGEIISLRWRAVDFVRRSIYVIANVSAGQNARAKDNEGLHGSDGHSGRPVVARLRPDDALEEALVFPSRFGAKLDDDALSSRYVACRDAAGVPPLRFHDLRHTVGSLAVDGGASVVQVKDWMGHSDIKTTMRYVHSKSRVQDAALLDEAFKPSGVDELPVADQAA